MQPPRLRNKLLAYLTERRGQWVTRAELLDMLYDDRGDGGPDCASAVLLRLVFQARQAGIPIEQTSAYRLPPRR